VIIYSPSWMRHTGYSHPPLDDVLRASIGASGYIRSSLVLLTPTPKHRLDFAHIKLSILPQTWTSYEVRWCTAPSGPNYLERCPWPCPCPRQRSQSLKCCKINISSATPVGDGYGMRRSSFKRDTGSSMLRSLSVLALRASAQSHVFR